MTPQQLFERAQSDAMPQEDLAEYQGLWVALRDGYVVAANVDAVLLREDDDVRDDDMLIAVPPAGHSILIA